MNKISRICGVAVVMFVCAIRLDAQSPVIKLDSLSIWNASRIALQYNPQIRAARSGIEFSEGGLRLNRSNYYPNISANASAQRTEGAFVLNPAISAREQKYNSYSAGITLNQLIYDFGKTAGRVSSSESLLEASSYDYKASQENVLVNVQTNYFSYLQAQFILKVNEETVKQAEEHLKVARAFFNAGTRPEYDVTKAEVDLANANVTVIRSRNAVQIAKLQLDNSMGIQTSDDYTLVDSFRISPNKINLDSARIIAFENRSELKSLNLRLASNESLVSAAWDNNLPTLSASGSYNWNGFDLPLASRWVFGLNFSLPIFQGFAVNAQVQQNQANVEQTKANIEALKQSIALDVAQNYLALDEALNRTDATRKLMDQANANLRLAEGRYNSGVGSAIEITDAQIILANAKITNIQALYDYNTALIRLKKAIGVLL